MEYLIICITAFTVSGLTLFSGFGLGTVLMPAFALFFSVPIAIAATALIHLANNIFKVLLVGKHADRETVIRFAVPGVFAAFAGAALLSVISEVPPVYVYRIGGRAHDITAVKIVIGLLIVLFALFELLPRFRELSFDRKYLLLGGVVSGFFGGLSGNQGALRSAFLIKAGLEKEAFIGTSTVTAVIVDVARLLVYGAAFYTSRFMETREIQSLVLAAAVSAFIGSFLGARLIKKVTLAAIQLIIGIIMIVIGLGMGSGLI